MRARRMRVGERFDEVDEIDATGQGQDVVLVTVPQGQGDLLVTACNSLDHHVTFSGDDFVIEHPLCERLAGTMGQCTLIRFVQDVGPSPMLRGRYRAWLGEGETRRWNMAQVPS